MAREGQLSSDFKNAESSELEQRVAQATDFFLRYEKCIRSIITFVAPDPDDAEDLYQDFYVSIVKKPLPEGIEDVEGYLYRTLLNRSRGKTRQAVRYRESLKRYAGGQEEQSEQRDVAEEVSRVDEAVTVLKTAKRLLGRREYEALRLRYYEGQCTFGCR